MTTRLDLSDVAVLLGLLLLAAGLAWVHPGWLVALVGAAVVTGYVGRAR